MVRDRLTFTVAQSDEQDMGMSELIKDTNYDDELTKISAYAELSV